MLIKTHLGVDKLITAVQTYHFACRPLKKGVQLIKRLLSFGLELMLDLNWVLFVSRQSKYI